MRNVKLTEIYTHRITQKYLKRSGFDHAITVASHAFDFAKQSDVSPDLAAKAGLLHDIGHYNWYNNGSWDYQQYKQNDIHAIKGAERAHKLLIRLGEDASAAKEIALAVLLHTDSYLPDGQLQLNPLQRVVNLADQADEEPSGSHHYREISSKEALDRIARLDQMIDESHSHSNESYKQSG